MICSLSHDAMIPGKQYALAVVEHFVSVSRPCKHGAIPAASPSNADAVAPVQHILRSADVAEVAGPVVIPNSVDVINFIWLFSGLKKPNYTVRSIPLTLMHDKSVSILLRIASNLSRLSGALIDKPKKITRIWVVAKDITDRVWNNLCSHAESPLSVVRGSVVGATDAPILYQIPNKMNIGGLNG
jgi:hypothetical protein